MFQGFLGPKTVLCKAFGLCRALGYVSTYLSLLDLAAWLTTDGACIEGLSWQPERRIKQVDASFPEESHCAAFVNAYISIPDVE